MIGRNGSRALDVNGRDLILRKPVEGQALVDLIHDLLIPVVKPNSQYKRARHEMGLILSSGPNKRAGANLFPIEKKNVAFKRPRRPEVEERWL